MLGIIVVNYKTIDETVNFVSNELSKVPTHKKVVVVNVACNERTNRELTGRLNACFVESLYSQVDKSSTVFILASTENLGFARGNNLGAQFLNRHFCTDYLLITNNDLVLHGDAVSPLVEISKQKDDVGVVGPRIIGNDGRDQSPHRRIPFTRFVFSKLLYPLHAALVKLGVVGGEVIPKAEEGYYYRLMGCFMLIPTRAFSKIGGFDPATFLYGEEIILSERMSAVGLTCYFNPSAVITHKHGQTISKSYSSRGSEKMMLESQMYYYKHYRHISTSACLIGRIAVWAYYYLHSPMIELIKNIKR